MEPRIKPIIGEGELLNQADLNRNSEREPLLDGITSRRIRARPEALSSLGRRATSSEWINSQNRMNTRSTLSRFLMGLAITLLITNEIFLVANFISIDSNLSYYYFSNFSSNFIPIICSLLGIIINSMSIIEIYNPSNSPHFAIWSSWSSSSVIGISIIVYLAAGDLRRKESVSTGVSFLILLLSTTLAAFSARQSEKENKLAEGVAEDQDMEPNSNRSRFGSILSFISLTIPLLILHLAIFATLITLLISLILRAIDSSLIPPGHLYTVNPWSYPHGHLGNSFVNSKGRDLVIHLDCKSNRVKPVNQVDSLEQVGVAQRTILIESRQGVPGAIDSQWARDFFKDGLAMGDSNVRICYWDRPGYGFSYNSPTSSIPLVIAALTEALDKGGELARIPLPRPELPRSGFILVGYEYGALSTLLFSARNPLLIHSILLISGTPPSLYFSDKTNSIGQRIFGFFAKYVQGIFTELGIKRFWWTIKNGFKSRISRVLSTEQDNILGSLSRSKIQEDNQSNSNSLSAKSWNLIKNRFPQKVPSILLSSNQSTPQQVWNKEDWSRGEESLVEIVGKGLVRWERNWEGMDGCRGIGKRVCEKSLQDLVLMD